MAKDLEAQQPETLQEPSDAELSDEQLDQVAGGTIVAVNGGGNVPTQQERAPHFWGYGTE